jgi:hypothetical protein
METGNMNFERGIQMPDSIQAQGWSTTDETKFVDYLASRPGKPDWLGCKTARQLLLGYIEHAKQRIKLKTWGTVDAKEVIRYAQRKL